MKSPAPDTALRALVSAHVIGNADRLRDQFLSAQPFAHCVIEDFLTAGFAQGLHDDFPAFERGNSLNEEGAPAGKSVVERMHSLGENYACLDQCVQSLAFLELIGRITGIPKLRRRSGRRRFSPRCTSNGTGAQL